MYQNKEEALNELWTFKNKKFPTPIALRAAFCFLAHTASNLFIFLTSTSIYDS